MTVSFSGVRGRTSSSSSQSNDGSMTTRLRHRGRRVRRRRSSGRRRPRPSRGRTGSVFAARQSTAPSIAFAYGSISSLAGLKRRPRSGLVRAVHAVAVVLAGPDAREVAVPVVRRPLAQLDALLVAVLVEQAELDPLRVLARRSRSSCRRRPTPGRAGTACRSRPDASTSAAPYRRGRCRPRRRDDPTVIARRVRRAHDLERAAPAPRRAGCCSCSR